MSELEFGKKQFKILFSVHELQLHYRECSNNSQVTVRHLVSTEISKQFDLKLINQKVT